MRNITGKHQVPKNLSRKYVNEFKEWFCWITYRRNLNRIEETDDGWLDIKRKVRTWRCSFRMTTNEGKDDWPNSLSVAPIRSHVTWFINPFRVNSKKKGERERENLATYYTIIFRSHVNDVNIQWSFEHTSALSSVIRSNRVIIMHYITHVTPCR